jgi:uncharacterized membrane protein/ElaB/YqjD/DUF883 family membrane-anchored ribosome-binding protein
MKRRQTIMDRMLVVVFDNESKAYEGSRALQQLDGDGSIAVYATRVVAKNPDGTTAVKQGTDSGPLGTLTGTAVGSLVGLLGGPVGVAVGAAGGSLIGAMADLDNVRVGSDFLADVAEALTPGKVAVVAEVDEEWTTPVDTRMEALGGVVLRRSLWEVEDTQDERDIASIKADIAQLKTEHAEANAERKATLQTLIGTLNAKLQEKLDKSKARLEAIRGEADAKLEALKAKAAQSKHDVKAKQEQRMATVKKHYNEWLDRQERRAS